MGIVGGGAGVDGTAAFGAGAVLGYVLSVKMHLVCGGVLTFETMHTMKPFSSILYDSTVFASANTLPTSKLVPFVHSSIIGGLRTSIDES